jgi:hypothetical protein
LSNKLGEAYNTGAGLSTLKTHTPTTDSNFLIWNTGIGGNNATYDPNGWDAKMVQGALDTLGDFLQDRNPLNRPPLPQPPQAQPPAPQPPAPRPPTTP